MHPHEEWVSTLNWAPETFYGGEDGGEDDDDDDIINDLWRLRSQSGDSQDLLNERPAS